jgi:hypothetical protein
MTYSWWSQIPVILSSPVKQREACILIYIVCNSSQHNVCVSVGLLELLYIHWSEVAETYDIITVALFLITYLMSLSV